MKKKIDNIYDSKITFSNVLQTWNIVRKTCKDKVSVYRFHFHKMTNILNICQILKERKYEPLHYSLFMIFEPKARLVMNQSVYDKVINHFVSNFYLLPYLETKLINSNVATRKGMGSSYAMNLFTKYINTIRLQNKDKEIYVLKIDIRKYFYNIDHKILLNMLKRDIQDQDVINIVDIMIKETNKRYVNQKIIELNKKYHTDIPLYKKDVGLAIGSMHSQFLAIYFLNDLDHYIKEKLKCKYYIRYMDDLIFISTDKNYLKKIWKIVEIEINKLNLEVNPKSNIYKISEGVPFVGYKFVVKNNKFKIDYNKKTLKKVRKKLKSLHKHNSVLYYKSYASYYGYFTKVQKNMERNFVMKSVDKYNHYKEEFQNQVVFIKEGNFYKTFEDDAKIIWDFFDYKWNNNAIAFGIMHSNKVFDFLKSKDLGYIVVTEELINVTGNSKVYELHKELANISYSKYQKKELLFEKLNKVLDKDFNSIDKIIDFINSFNLD